MSNINRRPNIPIIPLALAWLLLGGWLLGAPPGERLPEKLPEMHLLEFTGQEQGWPPVVIGREDVMEVSWSEIPGSLTDAREADIRRAVLQDLGVLAALGDRFAYISTGEVERDKDQGPSSVLITRVTFFSHTYNVAFEIIMRDLRVVQVTQRREYQPLEGQEEMEQAIGLARDDDRIRDYVQDLAGDAILAYLEKGEPGADHRVLYVSFSVNEEDETLYFATVDLTGGIVLSAGPAAADERRKRL